MSESVSPARAARDAAASEQPIDLTATGQGGLSTAIEPVQPVSLAAHETRARGARAPLAPILCAGCHRSFVPGRIQQRHCSAGCRARASRSRVAEANHTEIARLRGEVRRLRELLERLRPDDPRRSE
jgi:hypothetical protein